MILKGDGDNGPHITFIGDDGVERMTLFCNDRGPSVVLTDTKGFLRILVYVDSCGPDILVIDNGGNVAYSLKK